MLCTRVGGYVRRGGGSFLSSSALTLEIFALVPTKPLKVWVTTPGEGNSSSAFLHLCIFEVPLALSWGSGSDLLLSQNGRLFCDLRVQGDLMGPKPSGRWGPSTESKTIYKQGNPRRETPFTVMRG